MDNRDTARRGGRPTQDNENHWIEWRWHLSACPISSSPKRFLFKHLIDPQNMGTRTIPWGECVGFTADDRVKLTYHADGFAQFSSENPSKIISGRDPKTGEPRGLGLFTRPLSAPIVSGPSVADSVWGMDEFEKAEETRDLIIFEPDDFYYRRSTAIDANTWNVSIFAFAVGTVPPLRFQGKQGVMQYQLSPAIAGVPGAIVELKTIYLPAEKLYLGLYVERWIGEFSVKSGWLLHGPGNFTRYNAGYVLQAIYPRDFIPVEGRGSLDRNPSTAGENDSPSSPVGLGDATPE